MTWTRFGQYFRSTVISPEVVYGLLVLVLRHWRGFSVIGGWIADPMLRVGVPTAAVAAVLQAYKLTEDVLNPKGAEDSLNRWPDYWRLKAVVEVSLAFAAIGGLAVVAGAVGAETFGHQTTGWCCALGAGTQAVAVASVAMARFEVRDIVRGRET